MKTLLHRFIPFSRLGIMFLSVVLINTAAHAQVSSSSDFNPRKPKAFAGVNIGFNAPKADSDVYDIITSELTLEKSDCRRHSKRGPKSAV